MASPSAPGEPPDRRRAGGSPLQPGTLLLLHVAVLWSFGVAQPLYDLLAPAPEFLVAHHLSRSELLLLVVMLSVLAPSALVMLAALGHRFFGVRPGRAASAFALGLTAALCAAQLLRRLPAMQNLWQPAAALLVGGVFVVLYRRSPPLRSLLTLLSPSVALFALLFVVAAPVRRTLFGEAPIEASRTHVEARHPVLLVVLDELPLATLLDGDERIDGRRFPSFAALAAEADWYRNATSVAPLTQFAVPAILSGRYPDVHRLPTALDYPETLFTLLGGSYDLVVGEYTTQLCPPRLCSPLPDEEGVLARWRLLAGDLTLIYVHLTLAEPLAAQLPPVDMGWSNFGWDRFGRPGGTSHGSVERFDRFLERIARREAAGPVASANAPTLYYLHLDLPHAPWRFLPSGRRYGDRSASHPPLGLKGDRWLEDSWLTAHAWQRHLLQTRFTDALLGRLLTLLRTTGAYDRTLLIVTADHGASFQPGEARRSLSAENYLDQLSVPLFVKRPFQHSGRIDDRNVQSIDILPTLLDLLGAEVDADFEGSSLLDGEVVGPAAKVAFELDAQGRVRRWAIPADVRMRRRTVAHKLALFGSGEIDGGFDLGPSRDLLGQRPESFPTGILRSVRFELEERESLQQVDLDSAYLPAYIAGRVASPTHESELLALALNGTIAAVTRSHQRRFAVLVPEGDLRQGENHVEVFAVDLPGR